MPIRDIRTYYHISALQYIEVPPSMHLSEKVPKIMEKIHMLKELPALPVIAQELLSIANHADIDEFARVIEKDPGLSARLIGLANSAYFGWPGGVHSIYDAIYKVLGLKLVKSLSMGIVLNKLLETKNCKGFRPEQYWFTALATAIMTQSLFPHLPSASKKNIDTIYINGLLHNLGIAVLVHLCPAEMEEAFLRAKREDCPVTACIKQIIGIDQNYAGAWLGRRWGLPLDIVLVMEHHKELNYQQDYWPIVQITGYCASQAGDYFLGNETFLEIKQLVALGIPEAVVEVTCQAMKRQMEDIKAMASLLANGEELHG
jgi:HD-like signal output (HDOD) protein